MNLIKYPATLLYRIWFYFLVIVHLLLFFPFLFVALIKEAWYPVFFKFARVWAKSVLFFMGMPVKITSETNLDEKASYMFVANHTSMIDIFLMLVAVKNPFVFVGKKELSKIPVFGFFFKRSSILVDRSSTKSRRAVFASAQRRLNQGLSICIFPEGLVPDEDIELAPFKDGAFKLAINHQIPIVPLTFLDNKKRFSYTFFSGSPGKLRGHIHSLYPTKGLEMSDGKIIREKIYTLILNYLQTKRATK